jgi:hypothetical protein
MGVVDDQMIIHRETVTTCRRNPVHPEMSPKNRKRLSNMDGVPLSSAVPPSRRQDKGRKQRQQAVGIKSESFAAHCTHKTLSAHAINEPALTTSAFGILPLPLNLFCRHLTPHCHAPGTLPFFPRQPSPAHHGQRGWAPLRLVVDIKQRCLLQQQQHG